MKIKFVSLCVIVFGMMGLTFNASEVTIEDFTDVSDWEQRGIEISYLGNSTSVEVQGEGSLSREFCTDLNSMPYLAIKIPNIQGDLLWNIEVGSDVGDYVLQEYTSNINNPEWKYDKFVYPFKGYMIQNLKSVPDCYKLSINFTGIGTIELDELSSINFDKQKDYSFRPITGEIGNVNLNGNPDFDIDEIVNDVSEEEQLTKEHHWVVYPFSRLAIYPSQSLETIDSKLNMSISTFYGVNDKGTYKASPELINFNAITLNEQEASNVDSEWRPYKVGINAQYPNGELEVSDYFIDEDTVGRQIVNNSNETIEVNITQTKTGLWTQNGSSFVYDSKDTLNQYYFSMNFKQDAIVEESDTGYNLIFSPGSNIDMAIAFATENQGVEYAQEKSKIILTSTSEELLIQTKNKWSKLLSIVPMPITFGIDADLGAINEEEHRNLYYTAWAYLLGNMMSPTDEAGYQFGQQLLGKASMQTEGAPISSGNNSWESILQLQLISLVNPNFAQDTIYGFMTMVDANGKLDGEVLPTRFAQTVWITYNSNQDIDFLKRIYPSLKRFMEYKSENLHWIWGGTNVEDEVDSEFVISWLFDERFVEQISSELGYTNEVEYWNAIANKLLNKYYKYFFVDEDSLEAEGAFPSGTSGVRDDDHPEDKSSRGIWQRIYRDHYNSDGTNMHNNVRGVLPENVHMILTALAIPEISDVYEERLLNLFYDVYNPSLTLSGFTNYKYGPNSLLMYGLLEHGMIEELMSLLKNDLTKANEVWTFCELYSYNSNTPQGTLPTSFSTNLIIENTLMINGVMYYTGELQELTI